MNWLLEFDRKAFLFLNSKHSPLWDDLMWWASDKMVWIPICVILLINIIVKELPYRFIFTILFVAIAVTLSDQISGFLKWFFERPRPTHDSALLNGHPIKALVHTVNNYRGGNYGFVSSHAANAFCIFTFLASQFKSIKWGLFLFACALIISYSRIYLGVHYPLDIICGAIVGILAGTQCYILKVRVAIYIERQIVIREEKRKAKRKAEERKARFS